MIDTLFQAQSFRDEQEKLLGADTGCKHGDMVKRKLGDVTTININALRAGVSSGGDSKLYSLNVVPSEAIAGFDVRIAPSMAFEEFKAKLDEWCSAEGVSWAFDPRGTPQLDHNVVPLDETNVWWKLFRSACDGMGIKLETEVFPAGTDSRFLRKVGVPAIGFSPMRNTSILLHEHNESIPKHVFLEGIDVYETVFRKLFAHTDE